MHIQSIKLATTVLEAQKEFYLKKLKLPLLSEEGPSFTCQVGQSQLSFYQLTSLAAPSPTYHFAFNIPENQLAEAQAWAHRLGLDIPRFQDREIVDFPNWNAHALYFYDPAGNILEFIARHDLENASDLPFSVNSIENISEMGFPVPSVKDFYEEIHQAFQIPVYSHISNMSSFCAAGDPQGLCIIVPLERIWFPTELVNGLFPIEMQILGNYSFQKEFEKIPYTIISNT